jgi:hypothetical protein
MATATKNCIFYFVKLDSELRPIPGTMYSKQNNKIDPGYKCREARLTGLPMETPEGFTQCRNGLRYWYQLDSHGAILPNSLIAVKGIPTKTGGRPCQYIEFKIFQPIAE